MHRSGPFSRLVRLSFIFCVLCSLGFPVRNHAGSAQGSILLESGALQAYPYIHILASSASSVRFEFNAPAALFERTRSAEQDCQVVSMDGLLNEEGLGQFALPVQGAMLGIPGGAAPTLEILSVESETIAENFTLCLPPGRCSPVPPAGSASWQERKPLLDLNTSLMPGPPAAQENWSPQVCCAASPMPRCASTRCSTTLSAAPFQSTGILSLNCTSTHSQARIVWTRWILWMISMSQP